MKQRPICQLKCLPSVQQIKSAPLSNRTRSILLWQRLFHDKFSPFFSPGTRYRMLFSMRRTLGPSRILTHAMKQNLSLRNVSFHYYVLLMQRSSVTGGIYRHFERQCFFLNWKPNLELCFTQTVTQYRISGISPLTNALSKKKGEKIAMATANVSEALTGVVRNFSFK